MSERPRYRPEIDGLRAVAVLSVIVFHAHEAALPGGFAGVDIFFVISGYLITSILRREIADGSFSLLGFYDRRVRRIFPALFVVILACLPFAWALMTPDQLQDFSQSILATSVFLSNVYFYLKSGYFEPSSHLLPLLHTWSLAVEEQFYIVFPLLFFGLMRWGPRSAGLVIAGLAALSFGLTLVWGPTAPTMNFFLLPTRGWELLAGALLAIGQPAVDAALGRHPKARRVLELVGAVAVVSGILFVDQSSLFPGPATLPVVLGTVLLIGCTTGSSLVGRILASGPVVGIGLISYSAYLWHQPLFTFARLALGNLSAAAVVLLICATLGLAYLSWRFVEQPFRSRTWMGQGAVLRAGALAIVAFSTLGVLGHVSKGAPWRFDADTRALAATAQASPFRDDCHTDGAEFRAPADACVYGDGPATWAVFGDSHGVELALALSEALAPSGESVRHLTFSGCPPALGFNVANPGCHDWVELAVSQMEGDPVLQSVLIVYRHAFYLHGEHGALASDPAALASGAPIYLRQLPPDAARTAYWTGLEKVVRRLQAAGKTVFLATAVPELPLPVERVLYDRQRPIADRSNATGPDPAFLKARYDGVNAGLRIIAAATSAQIVPLEDALCSGGACIATRDGVSFYFDDNHLSLPGARHVVDDLVARGVLPIEAPTSP
ncbi:acyltransferase family protein [Meridianimarinicoccus roseus]|uniref:acyltransferase family protein n=1 Tax=Meridianimarinicoccus roseus TaxID=2072018 RepID=UPI001EE63E5B|nr:acyltransferase family protein [Meridianimarinicoccus roseus]